MKNTKKIGRNDPCWCGSGKKYKKCHGRISASPFRGKAPNYMIMTAETLPKMRRSCKLAANILQEVCEKAKAGVSTLELDQLALELTLKAGAYPAPLNYPKKPTNPRKPVITPGGFPKNICTSLNEVVCHGIPKAEDVLKDGDILNIDVTVALDGYYGDTSRMVCVGNVSPDAQKVVDTARECLQLGIEQVRAGAQLIDIGKAIFDHADARGLGVVREYTGHGVGTTFHADPQVCHYPNPKSNCKLLQGMTFTIEPMINLGSWQTILDQNDNWTVYTLDGKLSAQYEHSIFVTEKGYEILTLPG